MIWLLILVVLAFVQNMAFTLVSRSRNSGDPGYHRYCAWASNGVWFLCQVCIVKSIWDAIDAGNFGFVILAGIAYTLSTTEGSVFMMKHLLKTERGKRRVGARGDEKPSVCPKCQHDGCRQLAEFMNPMGDILCSDCIQVDVETGEYSSEDCKAI